MVCSNLKFGTGHNFPFSEKDRDFDKIPWAIAHGILSKSGAQNRLLILTHHLKGLSLNFQKIIKLTLLDHRN